MAKRSIYLDSYHDILLKHIQKISNASEVISYGLDVWFKINRVMLPNDIYMDLVKDLSDRSLTANFDYIPNWQLREDVIKWHHAHQPKMKSKQPKK